MPLSAPAAARPIESVSQNLLLFSTGGSAAGVWEGIHASYTHAPGYTQHAYMHPRYMLNGYMYKPSQKHAPWKHA